MGTSTHAPSDTDTAGTADPSAGFSARATIARYGVEVGPFGHLHQERERLAGLTWEHFDVAPLGATIGGLVSGIDLCGDLSDAQIAEIRQALLDYKVLFFRDQPLSQTQHIAFARRFGNLEVHPFLGANADHPELVRFEKGPEIGGYENGWHSDVTWREVPSMGAVLHAIETPASGGDTLFCDMYAAYESLDADTKAFLDGRDAIHDYSLAFGYNLPADEQAAMREKYPPVRHPVVRTHPETGRKLLYVNPYFVRQIDGMTQDESDVLMKRLVAVAGTVEFQCRFQWADDSVAFWDNRAVQHYASSDYWPSRRVMERASIIGDRPY